MMTSRTTRVLACSLPLLLLSACTITDVLSGDKVDYKSASEQPIRNKLEVPPDLNTLPKDDRFNMPDVKGTTLSTYTAKRAEQNGTPLPGTTDVLPTIQDAHLERAGGQRWLVVNQPPEKLWPILHDFWQENGFLIKVDSPQTGIMETDWAENRAKLPLDFVRRNLGRALDSIYDTGERDKFRTRLERRPDGGTEIYISHRGMVEVVTSQQNQTTVWTQRPSDPELEAEFLRRLLVRLGAEEEKAKTIVATVANPAAPGAANTSPIRAQLVTQPDGLSYVEVPDPFDRAWRRVGLALDRVSFTVVDRDRSQGIYYVRYVDPKTDDKEKPGFMSRIFSSDDKSKLAEQYRIVVKTQSGAAASRITVQNKDGAPETGDAGSRILALLNDQLK
ncbi:MAG: outer membrane protein assembly factor BamC [Burkholderiaceae bacterium]